MLCVGGLGLAAGAGSVHVAGAGSNRGFRHCTRGPVELRTRHVVVLKPYGSEHYLEACLSSGHVVSIADGIFNNAFYPPAVSARRYQVGYGDDFEDDPISATYVKVANIRTGRQKRFDTQGDQVSSVQVTPDGGVGWISCISDNSSPSPYGGRTRDCARPTGASRSFVYRAQPHGQPVLLDSGRQIEQFSLRLSGHTLSWVHSGRRRHARLR